MKVELDLSNYSAKEGLKRAIGIGTSMLASKTDLASLSTKEDNLDHGLIQDLKLGGGTNVVSFTRVTKVVSDLRYAVM